jgi:phosphopantetheine--protein transferase-like protein
MSETRQSPQLYWWIDGVSPVPPGPPGSPETPSSPGPWVWLLAGHGREPRQRDEALRRVAAMVLRCRAEDVILGRSPLGQPVVFAPPGGVPAPAPGQAAIYVSTSHREDVLAVAVSTSGPIGVDLETVDASADLAGLSRDYLSDAERTLFVAASESRRTELFYQFWTGKEAYLKAIGQGLGFGPEHVELGAAADGHLRLSRIGGSAALADGWQLHHRTVPLPDGVGVLAAVYSG